LRKETDDIPLRKQQIESRLAAHKDGQAQAEHALLEAKAQIKRLEGEIEAARQQIQKFREQQLQIKSNDATRRLEKEIATRRRPSAAWKTRTGGDGNRRDRQAAVANRQSSLASEQCAWTRNSRRSRSATRGSARN
jgi:predicted  nucleic acid-binding Zn-ribbon protein